MTKEFVIENINETIYRRKRQAAYVQRMRDDECIQNSDRKTWRENITCKTSRTCKNYVLMDLKKNATFKYGTKWLRVGPSSGLSWALNEPPGSIKDRKFLDQLSNC
jgi:hypothetical protein